MDDSGIVPGDEQRRRTDKPLPTCKSILLCDTTIIDAQTGKVSIIGIIDRFLRMPPGVIAPFRAFAHIIEGVGAYDITVEVHDLKEDTAVAKSPAIRANFPERLSRLNIIMPIPPLRLEHAGVYDVVLLADDHEIDRQRFLVEDLPSEEVQNEPS